MMVPIIVIFAGCTPEPPCDEDAAMERAKAQISICKELELSYRPITDFKYRNCETPAIACQTKSTVSKEGDAITQDEFNESLFKRDVRKAVIGF